MNTAAVRANRRKLLILAAIVLLCAAGYMLVNVNFSNPKLLAYAMKIRTPKLIVMLITAFAIGGASIVFQSIINNTIVTPCLLGMNSLYTLIHTAVVFFLGSASVVASNANLSFAVDVVLMGIAATVIYSWIFKKTKHNVLYVLLVGTVLTSFFGSIQTTLTRVMDPNEYDSLLNTLVASFSNINSEIIVFSLILLASVIFALRRELALLDVLTLGKEQAINLGVDYDRCIRRLLLGVTLCIAVATAMVGPISFLGLIIANLSRQLLKTFRHTQLVLGSAPVWHDRAGGRAAHRRACVFLFRAGERVHHRGRRSLLPLPPPDKKEGVTMRVQELTKQYDGKTVVDGVSFAIPKGKVISLIGPNGAGKSTVMGMISRLIAHDSGLVDFEGKDIGKWKSKELSKRLAILTQSNNIQMKLTVRELVTFGRFPYSGNRVTPEDQKIIDRAIHYMELEEFQDRFIDELSGGQRQRALIAMVIAQDTEYVLLDEPTNNLDIYHATNMMKIVRRLCDELGKTVILVLHEINYAAFYSDYICAFKDGKIAKFGTVEEVMTKENLSQIYQVDFEILTIAGKPLSIYY